ncbi:hypothetical protein L5F33_02290 [Aliarcobacter butzleri]|uniref:hypothetical protein n=1 Tax=Aliarcobacter butzleri TaxID=28197 RepID=UPI001EDF89D2|nr:hypothetical protein [Aliarcobacter butzleri]MCG3669079.1 hypothetical protein [Aliarcobacter butzleri]
MLVHLKEVIYNDFEKNKNYFYNNCDLVIFDLSENDLVRILNNDIFETKLIEIFNKFLNNKYYYFKSKIEGNSSSLILMGKDLNFIVKQLYPQYLNYLIKNENKYFLYLIIEDIKKKYKDKEFIISIKELFKDFNIQNKILSSLYCRHCNEINFHALAQNIYNSYTINNKDYTTHAKEIKIDFKKESNLDKLSHRMKVYEFIDYVNDKKPQSFMFEDIKEIMKISLQITQEYKALREEYLIINSYLTKYEIDNSAEIILGGKIENWDAKIIFEDKEIILEITQATSSYDNKLREALVNTIGDTYKGLSLKYRYMYQKELNEFPKKIIDAIEKKHKKNYKDNRILLVMVLFELAYFEENIIKYWINTLKKRTEKGDFREIILVINENNFFKIH